MDGWDEVILPLDWVLDHDHLDRNDRKRYVPAGIILDDVVSSGILSHVLHVRLRYLGTTTVGTP